jgi:O-antigen ligase
MFGGGLDNYRARSSSHLYSHSDYLEVAANTGIIGLLLYFSVYMILWLRLNRIKRMTDDPHVLYTVGLIKAIVIPMLLIAFGRVNITSKLTWIFLAAVFGYTWSVEKMLKRELLHPKDYKK